jgi:outer membrane protein OmpA-like peptidoglycan-associated protein
MARPFAARLIAALSLTALIGGGHATHAAGPPPPSRELSFPTGTLSFPTGEIGFHRANLDFPVSIERQETPTTIEVVLAADVLFDFDKADIKAEASSSLHELAQIIRDKAKGPVTIQGYTDALGADAYNQRLSERRAASVKAWLVANEKLAAPGLTTAGLGAKDPVAPNKHPDGSDDPDGRQRNRRVKIIIHK